MHLKHVRVITFIGVALGLTGCALNDVADFGKDCAQVRSIEFETGYCIPADSQEAQCAGCNPSDAARCQKFISDGGFKLQKCPKEYACEHIVYAAQTSELLANSNVCRIRMNSTQTCDADQIYLCHRGADFTCESSCDLCDPTRYTCSLAVSSEHNDSECLNGAIQCRDDGAYLCISGRWQFYSNCPFSCDAAKGGCVAPDITDVQCSSDAYRCGENNALLFCQNDAWKTIKTCTVHASTTAVSKMANPMSRR